MKRINFLILLIGIFAVNTSNAVVRTLNNNNPSPGQYTSFALLDADLHGDDTVYVSGSPISYGDITLSIHIVIIGTGFNPQKQSPLTSKFGTIYLSDYNVGSEITGIVCNSVADQNQGVFTRDITIKNCRLESFSGNNDEGGNYTLENNVINFIALRNGSRRNSPSNTSVLKLKHNLIYGGIFAFSPYGAIKNSEIENNIFIDTSSVSAIDFSNIPMSNTSIKNNIFINKKPNNININAATCTFSYNCAYPLTQVFTDNDGHNIIGDPLFVNYPCITAPCSYSYNQDFHLQAGSPCIASGSNANDIGIYDQLFGNYFTMSGEPAIPQMKQINMPSSILSGQSVNVNIITTVK